MILKLIPDRRQQKKQKQSHSDVKQ